MEITIPEKLKALRYYQRQRGARIPKNNGGHHGGPSRSKRGAQVPGRSIRQGGQGKSTRLSRSPRQCQSRKKMLERPRPLWRQKNRALRRCTQLNAPTSPALAATGHRRSSPPQLGQTLQVRRRRATSISCTSRDMAQRQLPSIHSMCAVDLVARIEKCTPEVLLSWVWLCWSAAARPTASRDEWRDGK